MEQVFCKCDPLLELRQLQRGACAVCNRTDKILEVDHDHATGLVRGLLCHGCNTAEGRCPDDPESKFAEYRTNPPTTRVGLEVQYGKHVTGIHPKRLLPWVRWCDADPTRYVDDWATHIPFRSLGGEQLSVTGRELASAALEMHVAQSRAILRDRGGDWLRFVSVCDTAQGLVELLKSDAPADVWVATYCAAADWPLARELVSEAVKCEAVDEQARSPRRAA